MPALERQVGAAGIINKKKVPRPGHIMGRAGAANVSWSGDNQSQEMSGISGGCAGAFGARCNFARGRRLGGLSFLRRNIFG